MNLIVVIGLLLVQSRQQVTPAAMALLLVGDQDKLSFTDDRQKDRDYLELMSVLSHKRPDDRDDVLMFDENHHQPVLQKKDTVNDAFLAEKRNTCTAICNFCETLIHRKWTALCETECHLQSTNFKLCVAAWRVNIRTAN